MGSKCSFNDANRLDTFAVSNFNYTVFLNGSVISHLEYTQNFGNSDLNANI